MGARAKFKVAIVFGVLIVGSALVALGVATSSGSKPTKPGSAQKYTPPTSLKSAAGDGAAFAAAGGAVMADKSVGWWASAKSWFSDKPAAAAAPVAPPAAARPAARVAARVAAPVAAPVPVIAASAGVAAPVVAPVVQPVAVPVAPVVAVAKKSKPSAAPAPAAASEATPDLDKLINGLDGLLKK